MHDFGAHIFSYGSTYCGHHQIMVHPPGRVVGATPGQFGYHITRLYSIEVATRRFATRTATHHFVNHRTGFTTAESGVPQKLKIPAQYKERRKPKQQWPTLLGFFIAPLRWLHPGHNLAWRSWAWVTRLRVKRHDQSVATPGLLTETKIIL